MAAPTAQHLLQRAQQALLQLLQNGRTAAVAAVACSSWALAGCCCWAMKRMTASLISTPFLQQYSAHPRHTRLASVLLTTASSRMEGWTCRCVTQCCAATDITLWFQVFAPCAHHVCRLHACSCSDVCTCLLDCLGMHMNLALKQCSVSYTRDTCDKASQWLVRISEVQPCPRCRLQEKPCSNTGLSTCLYACWPGLCALGHAALLA